MNVISKSTQCFNWSFFASRSEPCLACHKFEKTEFVVPELKPIKVVSPWHMIGVDLIGPFTKSRNGNSWCLTVTDHFTKWLKAIPIKFCMIPIKDETGEATSKAMLDIFNTNASPEVILSDRGHEHWNKVW
ncbi:unnamed protein product [Oncorhynchus mykiss]|uniref:Integrase catalytic domain-containing protein n=1 Tax=Oncorhynchus mykiss TaxID=8022 RepID=A0A060WD42_ONCMY|nr:unnamed protein product [Oncorhynchus mykiss]